MLKNLIAKTIFSTVFFFFLFSCGKVLYAQEQSSSSFEKIVQEALDEVEQEFSEKNIEEKTKVDVPEDVIRPSQNADILDEADFKALGKTSEEESDLSTEPEDQDLEREEIMDLTPPDTAVPVQPTQPETKITVKEPSAENIPAVKTGQPVPGKSAETVAPEQAQVVEKEEPPLGKSLPEAENTSAQSNISRAAEAQVVVASNGKTENAASAKKNKVLEKFEIKQMDIKDALGLLSLETGLEIVFDKNIKKSISLSLTNIKALDVLRIILDMSDLAYNEEDGKIHVMSPQEFKESIGHDYEEDLETRIVPLVYLKSDEVMDPLKKMTSFYGRVLYDNDKNAVILMDDPKKVEEMSQWIKDKDISLETEIFDLPEESAQDIFSKAKKIVTPEKGNLNFDEKSNRLIVTDTLLKIKEIEEMINEVDNSDRKIQLSIMVLQIKLSDEHLLGVDWAAIVSDYQSIPFPSFIKGEDEQRLSVGTITKEDYEILLEALDTVGEVNEIFKSEKTLVNDEVSAININLEPDVDKQTREMNEDIFSEYNEMVLNIIPTIEKDSLRIDLKPQSKDGAPLKEINEIEMENGSSIILGSLFEQFTVEKETRVPVLGNLPLINFVFKRQKQSEQKIEYVIFLTFDLVK